MYLNAASDMWANPFLICCGTSEQYEIGIEARGIFLLLCLVLTCVFFLVS